MGKLYIIRNGPPVYTLLTDKLQAGTTPSNILTSEGYSFSEIIERTATRSILGKYFLVQLTFKERGNFELCQLIEKLAKLSYVHVILFCTGKKSYLQARQRFEKLSPRTLDSYAVSNEFFEEYIKYRILKYNARAQIPEYLIPDIRRNLRGYTDINHFLYKLAFTENVTKKVINELIPRRKSLSVNTFPRKLFLQPDTLNLKKINEFLDEYKFYISSVVIPLYDFYEGLYSIYKDYLKGNFTILNYMNYLENHKDLVITESNALNVLDFFKRTSPLLMEIYRNNFTKIYKEKNNFSQFILLYKFILLYMNF